MDDKQMEKQLKKARRANYIVFGIAAALLVALAVGIIAELNRPLDAKVKTSGLQSALGGEQILAKSDASYYKFDGGEKFTALLKFSEWKKCASLSPSDEVVTFHLGRQYSLTLYGDGHAIATNGYAAQGSRGNAFYEIPADIAKAASDYIESHGTKLDFEDGVTQSMTMDSATSN